MLRIQEQKKSLNLKVKLKFAQIYNLFEAAV
jgi:hypothetical protein